MRAKSILLVVAAFLIGALAAGSIGVRVIREVRTDEDANSFPEASTTTVSMVEAYQVDPHETMIGSTAVIPAGLDVEGDHVEISYELVARAPQSDGTTVGIYPLRWEMETPDGLFDGGPADVDARVAGFDMYDGVSLDDILAVRILEARTPFPIEVTFGLSEGEPRVEVVPGVEVELLSVSHEGSTTVVHLTVESDDPVVTGVLVRGDGPGWRDATFEDDAPRIDLMYEGETLPDTIPLVATATIWREITGPFTVDLGGLE